MSSRDRPRDDDLDERLDELEDVLSELRADLRASERDRWLPGSSEPRRRADPDRERGSRRETDRRRDRSSDLPRPPRLSELVRFTEQYTIPTVIALLETTIKSLKLVQGTLRLLDPEGTVRSDTEATAGRLADVRDGATDGLARSLSELRTALAEADLPEETASRSIIEDARELTADIESRIEESRRRADDARRPDRRGRDERGRDERGRDGTRGDGSRRDEGGRSESSRDRAGRDRGHDGAVHIDVTTPTSATRVAPADGRAARKTRSRLIRPTTVRRSTSSPSSTRSNDSSTRSRAEIRQPRTRRTVPTTTRTGPPTTEATTIRPRPGTTPRSRSERGQLWSFRFHHSAPRWSATRDAESRRSASSSVNTSNATVPSNPSSSAANAS